LLRALKQRAASQTSSPQAKRLLRPMAPFFAQHSACKYCAAKAQLLFPERVDATRQDTDCAAERSAVVQRTPRSTAHTLLGASPCMGWRENFVNLIGALPRVGVSFFKFSQAHNGSNDAPFGQSLGGLFSSPLQPFSASAFSTPPQKKRSCFFNCSQVQFSNLPLCVAPLPRSALAVMMRRREHGRQMVSRPSAL
jgi:hypothetical protein